MTRWRVNKVVMQLLVWRLYNSLPTSCSLSPLPTPSMSLLLSSRQVLLSYLVFLILARSSMARQYYPHTKGLPWAKRQQRPTLVSTDDLEGSYHQLYSTPRARAWVQLLGVMKRSCSDTGENKGPRHLYVTICG